MRYQQIAFDVDGTLLDTQYANLQSLRDTLLTLAGQAPPPEELTFTFGITGVDALNALGVEDVPGALALWERNLTAYRDTVRVFPGIPQLLERLEALGLGLGVVTSRTRAEFDADFAQLPIAGRFQTVVCADETDTHKPHPEPLLRFAERTGCAPASLLYVGDSVHDMQCAANAGADFGLAGWGAVSPLPAPHVLQRPQDLLSLLG